MLTIDQIDKEALQKLIDNAQALSIDVGMVLRKVRIEQSPGQILAGDSLGIDFEQYLQLQKSLSSAIRHAIHRRVGQRALTPDEYEVAAHYMLGADDLGAALVRMRKFCSMQAERLGNGAFNLSIERAQIARLYVQVAVDLELQERFASHFVQDMYKLIEMLAWMIGEPIPLLQLEVPFAEPGDAEHELSRFRCPIHFGQSGFAMYFSSALLGKRIVRSIEELKDFLKIYQAVLLTDDQHDRPAFDQRIERILEKQCLEVGGMPSATQLAGVLNISEATLRRRLRDTGRSFSEIKQSCQLRLGKKLLSISYTSLFDVAQRLGYQDVNAFRRAFKQATGHTPVGFRDSCKPQQNAGY